MLQGAAYRILTCFIRADVRNFADVCREAGYPTDLGGYYLRQLVQHGFLERGGRGEYMITPKGRSQLAVGHEKQVFVTRPRLVAMLVARQANSYVVQRRARQPFIGIAEWPATSVRLGESLPAAVDRLIQERFGSVHPSAFTGFFRRTDKYGEEVFDDKLFAVHSLVLPLDIEIQASNHVGSMELQPAAAMTLIDRPSRSLLDIMAYVQSTVTPYVEHVYALAPSDFTDDTTN